MIRNQRGMALLIVMLFAAMCSLLAAYAMQHGQQQSTFTLALGGTRAQTYYGAEAGLVNAEWRIRTNYTADIGGGSFADPNYNPPVYWLRLADDRTTTVATAGYNVEVDIGPVNPVTRVRPIRATGLA